MVLRVSLLLLGLVFALPVKSFAQVLTLNRSECVKVDARISEMVPNHKYKRPVFPQLCGTGRFLGNQEELKVDTSAIKIEDTVSVFFIWRQNSVLRIVARKETKNLKSKKLNSRLTFPVTYLAGMPGEKVNQELLQFQQLGSCKFIDIVKPDENWKRLLQLYNRSGQVNLAINTAGYIVNSQCLPLVYTGTSGKPERFRIFNITGFRIERTPGNFNLAGTFIPEFEISNYRSGFTNEEEIEEDVQYINLKSKVKKLLNQVKTAPEIPKKKPHDWYYKLGEIYQEILDVTWRLNKEELVPKESNRPVPFLNYSSFMNWPWTLLFTLREENEVQFSPFYTGNSVSGYQVSNIAIYPETEGFTVMPGNFFLPNRLKIIAINNTPLAKYRPSILSLGTTKEPPFFPGGATAIRNYFDSTFFQHRFTAGGFVTLGLEIGKSGAVENVAIRKGISPEVDSVAKEAAFKMPRWLPAHQQNLPEKSWQEITVRVISAAELKALSQEKIARFREKLAQDNRVYEFVEFQPEFPGGIAALKNYLRNNTRYPNSELKKAIEGIVVVRFVVKNTGEINGIEILKKLSPALDAEAIRLVKSMPPWVPGKQNGELVNVHFTLPIRFNLPETKTKK